MIKSRVSLRPTNNPSVISVFDGDRYIGRLVKQNDISFVVKSRELIQRCGGFGVIPPIVNSKKIKYIIFIYQNRKYSITREKFLEVGKIYHLGEIEKICVHISYFNCEDDSSEPTLFDNQKQ